MKYVMLRFYDGGGLATYGICNCKPEDLDENLVAFEKDCISQNLGTRIGVLDENDIINIKEQME